MHKFLLLILFALLLLAFRFISFYSSQILYEQSKGASLEATLHEEPDLSDKGQKFSIRTSTNQIIFVTSKASPRLHYGDALFIKGSIEKKQIEDNRDILLMHYPQITVRKEAKGFIVQLANNVRNKSKKLFEKTLPPASASLLSGVVFGSKERFSSEFKQSLSTTGVLHVIAASGMNVTFVAGALLFAFGMCMKRQVALLAAVLGIIFYVFLVGFEPSIIRAAIMAILAFGAGILGRQNWAFFSLFLTGFIMLLWKPYFLFDVGFQLSFMATLGILFTGGLGRFGESGEIGKLGNMGKVFGESIITTFAAQAATLPILLGVFGSFGLLSLFVNGVVLWVVPILMTLGSLAVIVGFFFEPLAQLLLFLCLPFLLFFEAVVSFFGEMGINFIIEKFPWQMGVGYYLVLVSILFWRKISKS